MKKKRLYRVDAFWYVMAESKEDAVEIKPDWGAVDIGSTLTRDSGLDIGWWDVLPFNNDDNRSCGQVIHDNYNET